MYILKNLISSYNLDEWIKYIVILILSISIEYVVLGPIVQDFFELGLNSRSTVGGVTAPASELMEPTILYFYKLILPIIDIIGIFSMISGIPYFVKKLKY